MTADGLPAAVTYVGLPVSSGGAHSLMRMSRRAAYERTMAFLNACTEPARDVDYRFRVHDAPGLARSTPLDLAVRRRFGIDAVLPAERVPAALDFLDEIDPQPANEYGMVPVWFWAECRFRILDPATGRPLLGQDPARFQGVEYAWRVPLGTNGLRLILNDHAALGIELCIPDADEELRGRVVPWLQEHLPFRFSAKHWRVWTPTKSGSYTARRLIVTGRTR
jgi:hypothetical protein